MELKRENILAMIYYDDFCCCLNQQQCIIRLISAFGDEAPSKTREARSATTVVAEKIDVVRRMVEEGSYVTYDEIQASFHKKTCYSRWVPDNLSTTQKEDLVKSRNF